MATATYNWDDLQVASMSVNETLFPFFIEKHTKHEKNAQDENNANQLNIKSSPATEDKNVKIIEDSLKNIKIAAPQTSQNKDKKLKKAPAVIANNSPIKTRSKAKVVAPETVPSATSSQRKAALTNSKSQKKPIIASSKLTKAAVSNGGGRQEQQFAVTNYAKIYEAKKKRLEKKRLEEEKKLREFNPRKMPNFTAIHQKMETKLNDYRILPTCPKTPKVLLTSLENAEKRDKKLEEYKKQLYEVKPIIPQNADVLHREPYKVKLSKRVIQSDPFDLRMSARLQERRVYDQNYEKDCEIKRKKEEELRQIQEELARKMYREQTVFKATPNPFA